MNLDNLQTILVITVATSSLGLVSIGNIFDQSEKRWVTPTMIILTITTILSGLSIWWTSYDDKPYVLNQTTQQLKSTSVSGAYRILLQGEPVIISRDIDTGKCLLETDLDNEIENDIDLMWNTGQVFIYEYVNRNSLIGMETDKKYHLANEPIRSLEIVIAHQRDKEKMKPQIEPIQKNER